MKTRALVLLAAAVGLVNGLIQNILPLPCGKCGLCCPPSVPTYDRTTDTCTPLGGGPGCALCGGTCSSPLKFSDLLSVNGLVPSGPTTTFSDLSNLAPPHSAFSTPTDDTSTYTYSPFPVSEAVGTPLPWHNPEGLIVRARCGFSSAKMGCDSYVGFYRCATCKTGNWQGLVAVLMANGYKPHNCGPSFTVNPSGTTYNLIMYHREIANGDSLQFSFADPVDFVVSGMGNKVKLCGSLDANECDAYEGCRWRNGGCEPGWCPKNGVHHGPSMCSCPTEATHSNGTLVFLP